MDDERVYQRLLSFAIGFSGRFALALASSSNLEIRRRWQERLTRALAGHEIEVVSIHGDGMQEGSQSLLSLLDRQVLPADPWILSLSHFEAFILEASHRLGKGTQDIGTLRSESFLGRLNFEREALIRGFPVPMILWTSPAAVRQMADRAPDFYDFRRFILDLPHTAELRGPGRVGDTV